MLPRPVQDSVLGSVDRSLQLHPLLPSKGAGQRQEEGRSGLEEGR